MKKIARLRRRRRHRLASQHVASGAAPLRQCKDPRHRGIHQVFFSEGLDNDTCTAERIETPRQAISKHDCLDARGDGERRHVVELDVHLTPDRQFAVFHD